MSLFFFSSFFVLHSNILLRFIKKLQRTHKYHYRCGISHPCGKLRQATITAEKQQQAAQFFNPNVAMESIRMKQRKCAQSHRNQYLFRHLFFFHVKLNWIYLSERWKYMCVCRSDALKIHLIEKNEYVVFNRIATVFSK